MKSVSFLLPTRPFAFAGGYAVIYEYANRMADDGIAVTLVYPHVLDVPSPLRFLKEILRFVRDTVLRKCTRVSWFSLRKNVREKYVFCPVRAFMPRADVCVATAVTTAKAVALLHNPGNCYFIQHFEKWEFTEEQVLETYRYPLRKIVIAPWLLELVQSQGADAALVPNGFDPDVFRLEKNIEERDAQSVSMLYHVHPAKGCDDAFAALDLVKRAVPGLKVRLFGVYPKPASLPDWYEYVECPSRDALCAIYNSTAVYVAASTSEGWGLTIGEAMQCGCAVACTDNPGFACMANADTALLSPIREPEKLADNILRLIRDDELRRSLAYSGNRFIQSFSIEEAYRKFKSAVFPAEGQQ